MAQTIAKASSVAACTILFPTFCRSLPFSMLDEMFGNAIRHWVWVHVLHFPLTSFHVNSYVYMAMQRMCLRALFFFDDWFMSYLFRTLSAISFLVNACAGAFWMNGARFKNVQMFIEARPKATLLSFHMFFLCEAPNCKVE